MTDEQHRSPASIIVPAHNEQGAVARLLTALTSGPGSGRPWEIIVVANGCSDETATIARGYGSTVRVIETEVASKANALDLGNDAATSFPRVLIDADVEIDAASVAALLDCLEQTSVLACGPVRDLQLDKASWVVRAFYRVWTRLPQVRSGLFGRGVIALSKDGVVRTQHLPHVMSDDLAVSSAFDDNERQIVASTSVRIWPPRTVNDLLRRRTRIQTGNAQMDQQIGRRSDDRTSAGMLLGIARAEPARSLDVLVFIAVSLTAKVRARRRIKRGDYQTWLRDESSRLTS